MSGQGMDNAYFVIMLLLYICIDQGDGHWKEKDRAHLRHDIGLYRKMAEKIEREIESFYDEYPEGRHKEDDVDRIRYKRVLHKVDRKTETGKQDEQDKIGRNFYYGIRNNITIHRPTPDSANKPGVKETMKHEISTTNASTKASNTTWPKFEDILSAIGKKYDWKNDRWIKVKYKIKNGTNKNIGKPKDDDNSIEFHEKHKFSYRIVRLSKNKSRRNVVVAVSAIR